MRTRLFRILSTLLGAALLILALPVATYGPGAAWVNGIPGLLIGALFLRYGITGKTHLLPRKTKQNSLLGEIELIAGQWGGRKHFPPAEHPIHVYFENDAALIDEQIETAWNTVSESYPDLLDRVVRALPEQYPDLELSDDFGQSHVTLESIYIITEHSIGLTWGVTVKGGSDAEYEAATRYDSGSFELLGVAH